MGRTSKQSSRPARTTPRPRKAPSRTPARPSGGELLLEIGTEELPYQFIPPALRALQTQAEQLLKEHRLAHGAIRTLGTPRRLTLSVEALADRQAATVKETMGPSKAVGFDAAGQPTKAALGFAAGQGVGVADLETRQTPKGEYLFAVKREAGQPTKMLLAELLPLLIGRLAFPKAMRWNDSGVRFGRPIRWLLALYAGKPIGFQVAGVRSGNRTYGHRFLAPGGRGARSLPVTDLRTYQSRLARHGVLADQDSRRDAIVRQLDKLAKTAGGRLHRDEDLLEQAIYTTEWPQAILGKFNPQYLSLPKEILMTSMKEHQGFFSVLKRDGSLLPCFLSVTNMTLSSMRLIQQGNERVLAARLADAKFFFDEDRKLRLADRVEKLSGIVFHQKLGTIHDRQQRIRHLAERLAVMFGLDEETRRACIRAADLCKTDLTTGIVGEFPVLQGVMGGEYARHDGEPEAVSRAIAEHYLPPSMEGGIPTTPAGRVLALADRLDTVFAFFRVDLVPSGSEDPFALRRSALAAIRIVLEGKLPLHLGPVAAEMAALFDKTGFKPAGPGSHPVAFILERLRYYGRSVDGLRDDVMQAVLQAALRPPMQDRGLNLLALYERMKALQAITRRAEFDPLIVGFKRAHRIVEKEQWEVEEINPALLEHESEQKLYAMLDAVRLQIPFLIEQGDYAAALGHLVALKPSIDAFFNGVLVNAENPGIRANRLSLLRMIDRLFLSFADLSEIQVPGN